CLQYKSNPLTF
nr:immunoglobulin light chain junction region [Macaca mulatta]